MRTPRTALFASALVLLAATVAMAAPPQVDRQPARDLGVTVGVSAPRLVVDRVSGEDPASLDELAGRVVVLDFWATWCGACQTLMPLLDQLQRDYHDAGLSVIGISHEPSDRIRAHLSRNPVSYTIARDLGRTTARYRVRSLPTLVIIGRDGKVRHMMVGMDRQGAAQLVNMIPRLLDEATP